MGIRVRKFLGYGLTGVECQEDPRINWDSPLVSYEDRDSISIERYQEFLKRREAEDTAADPQGRNFRNESAFIRWSLNAGKTFDLSDTVTYDDGESDDGAKVLVIRPLTDTDWYRFDETIDWMEESHLRYPDQDGNGFDRVDVFPRATIYPYQFWMDRRDGRRLGGMIFEWIRASRFTSTTATTSDLLIKVLDEFAKDVGFKSHEEAWANVVPGVPEAVRDVVEFGHLFTDSRTTLELRPMLYTFWR